MAGTIKFFDEMQNASNVSGQDKMMIGKAESGETQVITFDQAKQYLDITSNEIAPIIGGDSEANATPVPAGPDGQTRRADVAPGWIDFGSGPIEASSTNRWMAYWDGSSWSLVDMGELPQVEGTNILNPEGEHIPKEKAVADYIKGELGFDVIDISDRIVFRNWSLSTSAAIQDGGLLAFVKLDNPSMVVIARPSIQSNRFRVAKVITETLATGDAYSYLIPPTDDTSLSHTVYIDEPCYLVIYLNSPTDVPDPADINLNIFTEYLGTKFMDKQDYLEEVQVTGKNKYDKDSDISGFIVDNSTNLIKPSPSVSLTNMIPTKSGQVWTISGKTMFASRHVYFVENETDTEVKTKIAGTSTEGVPFTFTSPINGFLFTISKDATYDWRENLQIEKGSVATEYEPYKVLRTDEKIKGKYLPETHSSGSADTYSRNVVVELTRGSLNTLGIFPTYQNNAAWKDAEFYKNLRTSKFLNISASDNSSISINSEELQDYNIFIFEYGESFGLISRSLVQDGEFNLESGTKFVKFHLTRIDGGDIVDKIQLKVTANFKGSTYTYNSPDTPNTIKSLIEVSEVKGRDMLDLSIADQPVQYSDTPLYTNAILRLPKNYDPMGEPTRVIYFAHSSGGATIPDFNSNYLPYVQYLVDEGYAVVDVFAWTNNFPDAIQYMNTPTNIACTNAMYKFISENYNIRRDGVFIFGKSHGGYQVYAAEYMFNFKILAGAALAGAIHFANKNYGYHNPDRLAVVADLEIPEDPTPILTESGANYNPAARAWFRRNADYFHGYIPLTMGSINFDPIDAFPDTNRVGDQVMFDDLEFTATSNVPVKSWVSPDDGNISVSAIFARHRAVKKGAGLFEIRLMPQGTGDPHHTVDTAGPFVPSITTKLGVVHENVPVAWAEMLQFFKRFEI